MASRPAGVAFRCGEFSSTMATVRRRTGIHRPVAVVVAGLLALTGCTAEPEPLPVAGAIIVGTTDEVTSLDPAAASDRGSLLAMANVYPHLLTTVAGSDEPVLDVATLAEFTSPTEFTVQIRQGLKFANGNDLTASDVKFSFDRVSEIAAEGGPARVFESVSKIEAVDESTVVFTLGHPNDELWPHVLASPAAAIVDEEVFSANAVTSNSDIVRRQPFAGQFVIETFRERDLVQFRANEAYEGALGEPLTATVNLRHYGNPANLLRAVRDGDVDLATRGFSAENIASVESVESLTVHSLPGSEVRFLSVDPVLGPFGSGSGADPAKALAVRQAMADLVDRRFLVSELYEGAYEPLWSFVPGAVFEGEELLGLYGSADGGPDQSAALARFRDAGVTPPVSLDIHFSPELYDALAEEELDWVARQLMQGGLFSVELVPMEAEEFVEGLEGGGLPVAAVSFFPTVFDAEDYTDALFGSATVLGERFAIPEIRTLLETPTGGESGAVRSDVIAQQLELLAERVPVIPLLQGNQVLIASVNLLGVEDARAGSQLLRFAALSK